ncbi:MAG: HIRAN domain-containing protein [Lachnospiraceae bacterium]|nr:HIRAN domain-containing protein [Lachnospiraceae bacterium]
MSDNSLTVSDKSTLEVISKHDIGDMIKPFIKEIYLFETYIAGTSHIDNQELFESLKEGDSFILVREENKYDEMAIKVLTKNDEKLGYIPERDNEIFSRLMDAGKKLTAKMIEKDRSGHFWQIKIGIYLVDI